MDISSLSNFNVNTLVNMAKKVQHTSSDFDAALAAAEIEDADPTLTAVELKALLEDPNSTIPENIRKSLLALLSEETLSPDVVKKISKQIAIYAANLADTVTFSVNPTEVADADFNLQMVMLGMLSLVTEYGQKPALNDLVTLWKKVDTRSASFESLDAAFSDMAETVTFDFAKRDDMETPGDKQRATFDLQYALWAKIAASGHLDRAKPLLATFEASQQMRLAKLEFQGEPLDSLIDDASLSFDVES